MFKVHFEKLRKNDFKSNISFKAPTNLPPKKLTEFNMQYITTMKCITTNKKLTEFNMQYITTMKCITTNKKLTEFNMQYITTMKCITTNKKLGKSGVLWEKLKFLPLRSYTSNHPLRNSGTLSYEIYSFGMGKT